MFSMRVSNKSYLILSYIYLMDWKEWDEYNVILSHCWRISKGFETFRTSFFQSVFNGHPNVLQRFCVALLKTIFGAFCWKCVYNCCCCLRDSGFDIVQNTIQGYYRLPVGTTELTPIELYGKQSRFNTGRK